MARPISVDLADIASRANVSIASVSRVLNNRGGVSEKMRSKIRAILEDDGRFSAHVSERGARVAVLVEMQKAHFSTYLSLLLTGIADYALRHSVDISTVFVQSGEKGSIDFLKLLRDRQCDGVILLLSKTVPPDELARLTDANMAVMVLGGECDNAAVGNLYTDPEAGIDLLLKHLDSLGHKNIAFLSGPTEGDPDNTQRLDAFCRHVRASDSEYGEQLLAPHQPTCFAHEAGYLQALDVLRRCPGVTAIIANNDEMAYGAVRACHERGLSVPDDVSIAGFDDYPSSQYMVPSITTIRQYLTEIGYQSAEHVCEYVCGSIDFLSRKVYRPELIVRDSTARVHKA